MKECIDVLVVEDSPSAQLNLVRILNSDARVRVVGTANNGSEAIEFLKGTKPDVIVMDVHMPGMDGYETTRQIMETQPVPIVICSGSISKSEMGKTFLALDAGAVALVAKPGGPGHLEYDHLAGHLLATVRLMSEVKVVKRWPKMRRSESPPSSAAVMQNGPEIKVVAIGTSTGGPPVLQTILAGLPKDLPAPVLIVQHIATGFLPGLVDWLGAATGFPIHIASHGETALPGHAYLAPDSYHMGLGQAGRISLSKQDPENGLRPSVGYLFRSVASSCGANSIAVLLTGMGKDGASELRTLKDMGAVTIAQDEESSVVHGMPGEAIKLGAANYILSPEKIPAIVAGLARQRAI